MPERWSTATCALYGFWGERAFGFVGTGTSNKWRINRKEAPSLVSPIDIDEIIERSRWTQIRPLGRSVDTSETNAMD